ARPWNALPTRSALHVRIAQFVSAPDALRGPGLSAQLVAAQYNHENASIWPGSCPTDGHNKGSVASGNSGESATEDGAVVVRRPLRLFWSRRRARRGVGRPLRSPPPKTPARQGLPARTVSNVLTRPPGFLRPAVRAANA